VWIGLNWFSIRTTSDCGNEIFGFCEKQGMDLTGDCFQEEGDIYVYIHSANGRDN
jgi:hypothetical protein